MNKHLTENLTKLMQEHGSMEVAGAFFEALVEMERLTKGTKYHYEHKQVSALIAHIQAFKKAA